MSLLALFLNLMHPWWIKVLISWILFPHTAHSLSALFVLIKQMSAGGDVALSACCSFTAVRLLYMITSNKHMQTQPHQETDCLIDWWMDGQMMGTLTHIHTLNTNETHSPLKEKHICWVCWTSPHLNGLEIHIACIYSYTDATCLLSFVLRRWS